MRHESKLAAWIRSGGNSVFVLPLGPVRAPEVKFSVVPDRLLDSIIDDALVTGVARLNAFLPEGVSIDITSVDLTTIRDQLRTSVADRLNETGAPVNPNDPVIKSILARYAEALNGHFQTDALQLENYIWRSQDDARVRAAHADYDDQAFAWSVPPAGGHPGQDWNCRCTAEPIVDLENLPDDSVCDILTGDRLASVFPDAPSDRLAAIARELDLRIVSGGFGQPGTPRPLLGPDAAGSWPTRASRRELRLQSARIEEQLQVLQGQSRRSRTIWPYRRSSRGPSCDRQPSLCKSHWQRRH